MKLFTAFFVVLTAAELVFSVIYYLVSNRFDRIMLIGAIIYLLAMLVGYIAFRIIRYNKKNSDLLDALPD
ncbi:MAG: hypothetical protein ACXWV0_07585 [Flavisolibacter sp.]